MPRRLTLQEHAESWLRNYVAVQRKPGTAEKYDAILRKHWFPPLGRTPLTALTRERIKPVLGEKSGRGFKPKTVNGHLDVLRACLSAAVEDQLIPANPAARLGKFVTRSGDSKEVETFTRAELTALLETAEREMPDAYPIVLTLARACLRIGEALTLQANDLDFERHGLWVRRTWGSRKKALGDRRINATNWSGALALVSRRKWLPRYGEAGDGDPARDGAGGEHIGHGGGESGEPGRDAGRLRRDDVAHGSHRRRCAVLRLAPHAGRPWLMIGGQPAWTQRPSLTAERR